ncbi:dynein axonemal assembly factor 4-like [Chironomus tepperi]|uniref:dynein axonemal assembly factor 4-like n=1 Tax=Chironomus tepperi TaxID=113505 RepID=UPI00391F3F94
MLIVKDFKWSQTEDEICIRVPLKNVSKDKVDIVTHENFIKIHASPYYFEAFLLHTIVEDKSICQLMSDEARFILVKTEPVEWEKLERDFIDNIEKLKVKNEILAKVQENEKEKIKKRLELKDKIRRSEVENAMAKDAEIREKIETVQKQAIQREISKVEEIKKSKKKEIPPKATSRAIDVKKKIEYQEPPPVRQSGSIQISFSKRNFLTPKRESQDPAEQEWLHKASNARKSIGFVPDDLRPEERDPMYLKGKGDDFFRQKNYLAAISAYTTGIQLAKNCFELYLNRSAAQFAQGNYQRCVEDCSKALELLDPPVASNLKARLQALTRRGAALSKLGFVRQAYKEFIAAVKLDPTDELLKHDAEMLRAKIENDYSSEDDND